MGGGQKSLREAAIAFLGDLLCLYDGGREISLRLKIWYNMNRAMDFITFCPNVMHMRVWRICDRHFHRKSRKKQKNKIRPANAIFDGVMKPSVRGAVKNHNPRKGTETLARNDYISERCLCVKNHNPRKGTETTHGNSSSIPRYRLLRTLIPGVN